MFIQRALTRVGYHRCRFARPSSRPRCRPAAQAVRSTSKRLRNRKIPRALGLKIHTGPGAPRALGPILNYTWFYAKRGSSVEHQGVFARLFISLAYIPPYRTIQLDRPRGNNRSKTIAAEPEMSPRLLERLQASLEIGRSAQCRPFRTTLRHFCVRSSVGPTPRVLAISQRFLNPQYSISCAKQIHFEKGCLLRFWVL